MKITLISPFPDLMAFGIRTISAYLKQHGHKTQLIFLPDSCDNNIVFGANKRYDEKALEDLIPLCKDSDLIGITVMTNFYEGVVQITEKLKSGLQAPVIWGGVHATIKPEESLEHADMVCVGDGEEAVLEVLNLMERRESYRNVSNIWVKENGNIIKNKLRNLTHDLDIYPRPDYSPEEQYILHEGKIKPLTYDLVKQYFDRAVTSAYLKKTAYQTMTGRGCPHKCTYCINDPLQEMYNNEIYLRWRSTEHVINELLWVKENFSYVNLIWISDDSFFARPKKNLEEFCKEYREKINLPFMCLASPMNISEEKMKMLVDAGLVYLQMGVESGSAKIQNLFNRKQMDNERLMKAFNIINKYKDRMFPPSYDFILDVPYETDEDNIESLKLIARIPKPFHLQLFSLILYPGTKLYEMAKSEGIIQDEKKQIYEKNYGMRDPSYLNLLFTLSQNGRFPSPILKFLLRSPTVDILNSKELKPVFKCFYNGLRTIYRTARKLAGRSRK
jgi:anaerobic magnesium-protoporphyrin IX monomethyl ester cyclase